MSVAMGIAAAVPRTVEAETALPAVTIATPKKPKAASKPIRRAAVKPPASTSPAPRFRPPPDPQLAESAAGARAPAAGAQRQPTPPREVLRQAGNLDREARDRRYTPREHRRRQLRHRLAGQHEAVSHSRSSHFSTIVPRTGIFRPIT